MKKYLFTSSVLLSFFWYAQLLSAVTFNVQVPVLTSQCWIVGNFNNWNNNQYKMTQVDKTHYTISIPISDFAAGITIDNVAYKYLSGPADWSYVEKDSLGAEIPIRDYHLSDVVQKWGIPYDVNPILSKYVTINALVPLSVTDLYLVGNFCNWTLPTDSTKMKFVKATAEGNLFSIKIWTWDAFRLQYLFVAGPQWNYMQTSKNNFQYPALEASVTEVIPSFDQIFDRSKLGKISIHAKVPSGTKDCWIQGNFLGWDMSKAQKGVLNSDGSFSFVVENVDKIEYRLYNSTWWDYPEVGVDGLELLNRQAVFPKDSVVEITVINWKNPITEIVDVISPSKPNNLQTTDVTLNSLILRWDPSYDNIGVVAYDVYQNEVKVGTTSATNWLVGELNPNTFYSFSVKAKDAAGNSSELSDSIGVKTKKAKNLLSIKSAESGSTELLCEYGAALSFELKPSVGWKLHTVFYNGVDVTTAVSKKEFALPKVTDDAELRVSFELIDGIVYSTTSQLRVHANSSEIVVDGTLYGESVSVITQGGIVLKTVQSQGNRILFTVPQGATYLIKSATKTVKVAL